MNWIGLIEQNPASDHRIELTGSSRINQIALLKQQVA